MAKGKSSNTKTTKSAKVVNASTASSGTNAKKIIAIIVAVIAIIILLLCLTCCNKDTDSKKLQGKVIEDKNKKEDKKDEVKDVVISYNNIAEITPAKMAFTPNKVAETKKEEEKDTEEPTVTLNGDNTIILEYMIDSYEEFGATYTDNEDGNGSIDAPTRITLDGSKVDSVDTSVMGEYTLIYSYTDAAGNTGIATRTIIVSDNMGPLVEEEEVASDTQGTAKYEFRVDDASEVTLVKIAKKNDTIVQDEEYFEQNGEELTFPYTYTFNENGDYIIYSKDENGNTNFYEFNVNTVPTTSTATHNGQTYDVYHRNINIDNPNNANVTNIKAIRGQNRLKDGDGNYRLPTADEFVNPPSGYTVVPYQDNATSIEITDDKGVSNYHWYYVHYQVEDETEPTIQGPYSPDGKDN